MQKEKLAYMGKTFDKIGVSMIAALLAFLLFFRITKSIALAAISAILSCCVCVLFLRLIRPREPKNLIGKRNFIRYVLLNGNRALKTAVETSFTGICETEEAEGHTILHLKERTRLYYTYKFGSLSEEDVAKSYRLAEKTGCAAIYAITNHLDRKALAVTEYIPQRFTVINAATLYKYLEKRGLIPKKEALPKKKGKAIKFLQAAFNREHTKYYVWAGLSTALLALFTPITTYYIVFSFINLALAMATIFLGERSAGEDHLFRD